MKINCLIIIFSFLVVTFIPLQSTEKPLFPPGGKQEDSKISTYYFDWNEVSTSKEDKIIITDKITPDNTVRLRITRVNWLRYKVITNITRDTSQSYKALESMWSKLIFSSPLSLTSSISSATPTPADLFLSKWKDVKQEIFNLNDSILKLQSIAPTSVQITNNDSIAIVQAIERLHLASNALEISMKELYSKLNDIKDLQEMVYARQLNDYVSELYIKQQQKLKDIYNIEKLFKNGFIVDCGQSGSGILNTVEIKLVDIEGVDNSSISLKGVKKSLEVVYFVSSKMPVVFHVGVTWSSIKDVNIKEFGQKVNQLGNINIFKADTTQQNTGFIALMSYPLSFASSYDQSTSLMLSLGTRIDKPGENLLMGLSLRLWDNFTFTLGAETKEVKHVDETSKEVIDNIDVYKTFKDAREWGFFFGISIIPY